MVIGLTEDCSSNVVFDTEVTAVPVSGVYANSGVHPSVNTDNLLSFLPKLTITPTAWSNATTYGIYSTTRKRSDLVSKNSKIYQSIKASNLNKDPETETTYWLETNLESLRIKAFLASVKDKVLTDLKLTKRLINNQFIYENEYFKNEVALSGNYAGWVFESKGSDYVIHRINQNCFTKSGTTPVNLYVINQGVLKDTLTITPSDGVLEFKDLNYSFSGKGRFIFAFDSTTVFSSQGWNDPLKFDGFVCYPTIGVGNAPETANYNFYGVTGNGLGFNVSSYLDSNLYIENNLNEFANFVKATFEYMAFQMYLSNSNNRSNRQELIQMSDNLLSFEVTSADGNSAYTRYQQAKKDAFNQLKKTFDTQLYLNDTDLEIETSSM